MAGKWVTKATGKTPPVGDYGDVANETITMLVQGKNSFGDDIYAFIHMPMNRIAEMQFKLAKKDHFMPSEFGSVLAAGRGKPTKEIMEEVGTTEFMIYYEPPRLPNLPSSVNP